MTALRFRSLLPAACAAALLTVACGESRVLNSPVGPSRLPAAAMLAADDGRPMAETAGLTSDVFGKGNGGSSSGGGKPERTDHSEKDKSNTGPGAPLDATEAEDEEEGESDVDGHRHGSNRGPAAGSRGMLSGFVTAVDDDSLTIRGVDVLVSDDTTIRHGNRLLTLADVQIGDHAQARGTLNEDGTSMEATEIKVEDTGHDNGEDENGEGEGTTGGTPPTP